MDSNLAKKLAGDLLWLALGEYASHISWAELNEDGTLTVYPWDDDKSQSFELTIKPV